jgi:hypothetical protein
LGHGGFSSSFLTPDCKRAGDASSAAVTSGQYDCRTVRVPSVKIA